MADLQVIDLSVFYGQSCALRDVSLHIVAGESVAVLGANGAGKSSLLRAVCGLTRPRSGSIIYRGRRINGSPPSALVRLGISLVPETRAIFTGMSVKENLLLGASARRDRKDVYRDISELCELFPVLRSKLDVLGGRLSGGQQGLLGIARALMARPQLLLLDEPSLGLAPLLTMELREHLKNCRNRYGMTVLIVEQNAGLALSVAERAYVLSGGVVVMAEESSRLRGNEALRRAYLGTTEPVTSNFGGRSV